MLIYLHSKHGGMVAIDADAIERMADLTERDALEAQKSMDGWNRTARQHGLAEQDEPTATAGGCRINGSFDVVETVEEVRALIDAAQAAAPAPVNPGEPVAKFLDGLQHGYGDVLDAIRDAARRFKG